MRNSPRHSRMCPSSLMTWSGTRCLSVLSIGHRSSMLGAVDHSVGSSPLTGSWPPSTHLRTRPCSCHWTTIEQTIVGSNPRKLTSTSPAVGHHQGVTQWQCVHSTMGARVDEGSHDGAIDHHSIDTWTSTLSLSPCATAGEEDERNGLGLMGSDQHRRVLILRR
jgi:hypothetical protein